MTEDVFDAAWREQAWRKFRHTYENNDGIWSVPRLWRAAWDLPELQMPVVDLVIRENLHELPHMRLAEMVEYIREVEMSDFSYPIILGPDGRVVDGFHRLTKARVDGLESIKVKLLPEMPPPGCKQCAGLGWMHELSEYGSYIPHCECCHIYADDEDAYAAHAVECGCPWSDTPAFILVEK